MKKYLFGLLAVAFAVTLSAFTTSNQRSSSMLVDVIYEFTGNPALSADWQNPQKWAVITQDPEVLCGDPDVLLCAISVPTTQVYQAPHVNAGKPKVDINPVKAEIAAAVAAQLDDVTGDIKVYLKPE